MCNTCPEHQARVKRAWGSALLVGAAAVVIVGALAYALQTKAS
jgi:hypothetical protein